MERQYVFLLSYLIIFLVIGFLRMGFIRIPSVLVPMKFPTFCEEIMEEFEINVEKNSLNSTNPVSISFCNFEKNHNYYLISAKTGRLILNFQTNESSYIFFTNYEEKEMYTNWIPQFMKFYLWDASINQTIKTIYVEK